MLPDQVERVAHILHHCGLIQVLECCTNGREMLTRHVKIIHLVEALFFPPLLTERDDPLPQPVLQGMEILPDTAQPVRILHGPDSIHDPVNDDCRIGVRIRTRLRQRDLIRCHTHKIAFLAIGKGSAHCKLQEMYDDLRLNEAIDDLQLLIIDVYFGGHTVH